MKTDFPLSVGASNYLLPLQHEELGHGDLCAPLSFHVQISNAEGECKVLWICDLSAVPIPGSYLSMIVLQCSSQHGTWGPEGGDEEKRVQEEVSLIHYKINVIIIVTLEETGELIFMLAYVRVNIFTYICTNFQML